MTAVLPPGTGFDPRMILGLGLPAHVLVRLEGGWAPAWLIGRLHCADGWVALVQLVDDAGCERTVRMPADRISVPTPRATHN